MGKFLKKLFFFLSIFGLSLVLASLSYRQIQEYYKDPGNYKIDNSITILLAGDSHIQTALDDGIIANSKNISKAGEHYLYTYAKLRSILNSNPQISTIVLGVGAHNFSKNSDKYIFDEAQNTKAFSDYFFLLNEKEVFEIKSNSHNWKINYLKSNFGIPFQTKLEIPFIYKRFANGSNQLDDYNFLGGYNPKTHIGFTEELLEMGIQRHFYNADGEIAGFTKLNEKYLKEILLLANSRDIKVCLVNTPVSDSYYSRIPEQHSILYKKILNQTVSSDKLVEVYDLTAMKLDENKFSDAHHLNVAGSREISKLINQYLTGH